MTQVRGRYAPSPTGHQTVGNARTALLAWLDVRSRGGRFVLRLDDTDPSRETVTPRDLTSVLARLGVDWDEGWDVDGPCAPYVTSERAVAHREAANALVVSGHAYWDYTPPIADVEVHKRERGKNGKTAQAAYRGAADPVVGIEPVLRLRVPDDRRVKVNDRVFGEIEVAGEDVGEVALLRSDGRPTYHLASCVDDAAMGITTVVRGADWLNYLPVHVLVFEALGAPLPEFAHVPLLVGPDGHKLSKRSGDLSVAHLLDEEGIPPGAVVAYLTNLGFPDRDDLPTLAELAARFDLAALKATSPRFDPKKLRSVARRWLAEREPETDLRAETVARAGVPGLMDAVVQGLLPGLRSRIGSYNEAGALLGFLGVADVPGRDPALVPDEIANALLAVDPWDAGGLEAAVNAAFAPYAEDRKERLSAVRAALAPGFKVTPPVQYLLLGLGRERAAVRLGRAAE